MRISDWSSDVCSSDLLVDVALRNRIVDDQSLGAREIGPRERQLAARARRVRPRFGERGVERARVDGEEQLPLSDALAAGEVDAGECARDANSEERRAGAGVEVRVDYGGYGSINKKQIKQ